MKDQPRRKNAYKDDAYYLCAQHLVAKRLRKTVYTTATRIERCVDSVRLSKNSCRGEHCSPVPVCLARNCPGKCVAAVSWRATNGRPYTRNKAKMQSFDGLIYYIRSTATHRKRQPVPYSSLKFDLANLCISLLREAFASRCPLLPSSRSPCR